MNKMLLYPGIIGIILGTIWLFLKIKEELFWFNCDIAEAVALIIIGILMAALDIVLIALLMGGGK